jgi:tetratricopeptide (TPR) repeat protein
LSRSYHTTRRHLKELEHSKYADKEKQAKIIDGLKRKLETKRLIKKQVKAERRGYEQYPLPTSIDSIPIHIVDSSPYIHYPAGPEDLRELMHRLPASLTHGLRYVELCLGKLPQEEEKNQYPWDEDPLRDPYTGRLSNEHIPGVYNGHYLGIYHGNVAGIQLFGYVYSPDLPHRQIMELYLRLKMLMVFVHELGHHFDQASRVARGRWLADNKEKVEIYAEGVTYKWAGEYVVPYLEQKYKTEVDELKAWILEHGGGAVPLVLLAGDPRNTAPKGLICVSFDVAMAFESLVEAVMKNEDPVSTQVQFAREIHYAEEYELPLAILKTVLAKHPENVEAITLKGEIFIHQQKYDKAMEQTETALKLEPENIKALEVLADGYEGLARWELLETTVNRLLELYTTKEQKKRYWSELIQRARARIGQSNYEGARADLDEAAKNKQLRGSKSELPRGRIEPLIADLNNQLQKEMNESHRNGAEQLRNDLSRALQQAENKWRILWPPT